MYITHHEDNIENMLKIDSINKKRNGRGIYNRASRKGYIRGGVKTAYDFLTNKEKKALNGEVKISHMYNKLEDIPNYKAFYEMDFETAKMRLTIIKNNYTNKQLTEYWDISCGKLYSIYNHFNCPKGKSNRSKKTESLPKEQVAQTAVINNTNPAKDIIGFKIELNGEYNKKEIEDRLLAIAGVLIDDERYIIKLHIEEE